MAHVFRLLHGALAIQNRVFLSHPKGAGEHRLYPHAHIPLCGTGVAWTHKASKSGSLDRTNLAASRPLILPRFPPFGIPAPRRRLQFRPSAAIDLQTTVLTCRKPIHQELVRRDGLLEDFPAQYDLTRSSNPAPTPGKSGKLTAVTPILSHRLRRRKNEHPTKY